MQFLFAKNDSKELENTREKISEMTDMIMSLAYKYDTQKIELNLFFITFVAGLAGGLGLGLLLCLKGFEGLGHDIIIGTSIIFIVLYLLSSIVLLNLDAGSKLDYGIIGGYLNHKWRMRNQKAIDAVPVLEKLCEQLVSIEKSLNLSRTVENYFKKYGDGLKISVNRNEGKNNNLYHLLLTGEINKTGTQLSFVDQVSKEYWLDEGFVEKTFREDTVDFSWIDHETDAVQSSIKQICAVNPQLPDKKHYEDLI